MSLLSEREQQLLACSMLDAHIYQGEIRTRSQVLRLAAQATVQHILARTVSVTHAALEARCDGHPTSSHVCRGAPEVFLRAAKTWVSAAVRCMKTDQHAALVKLDCTRRWHGGRQLRAQLLFAHHTLISGEKARVTPQAVASVAMARPISLSKLTFHVAPIVTGIGMTTP